jgi:hypothetical protein
VVIPGSNCGNSAKPTYLYWIVVFSGIGKYSVAQLSVGIITLGPDNATRFKRQVMYTVSGYRGNSADIHLFRSAAVGSGPISKLSKIIVAPGLG